MRHLVAKGVLMLNGSSRVMRIVARRRTYVTVTPMRSIRNEQLIARWCGHALTRGVFDCGAFEEIGICGGPEFHCVGEHELS